ncbi:hypothetical protein [Clostridium saccharoperbutylacetonicum]|uniref:hypothetical protein n=1 Tax=Clostridium saccharoperbutylacetonicum TaxID=36745 RepID=UPI0039EC7130
MKVTYCPHLTVGILEKEIESDKALDELSCCDQSFEIIIDKIYIESIHIIEHLKQTNIQAVKMLLLKIGESKNIGYKIFDGMGKSANYNLKKR